jgi:hypothetical protein
VRFIEFFVATVPDTGGLFGWLSMLISGDIRKTDFRIFRPQRPLNFSEVDEGAQGMQGEVIRKSPPSGVFARKDRTHTGICSRRRFYLTLQSELTATAADHFKGDSTARSVELCLLQCTKL